jgi:alpha-tubulin suppressor-like RCC1 family protein
VTPAHGPVRGGNQVTITGTDFREVTSVAFGPHNATSFTVKSPTSITAIAPAGSGRVSVTITTVGGTSEATPEDRYLYVLPGPRVSAWGANERGQLGAGLTQTGFPECDCSPLPQEVIDLGEVSAVATGSRSSDSLALLKNGTVMAWGDGFLGNGDALLPEQCFLDRCSTFPVQVSGLNEVTAVATGGKDSLALLRGGKVMAWGSNLYGGLGDGKRGSEGEVVADVPTPVSGLSEVSAIAVGANHDLALLKNGTVMAWGDNSDGELGDGTTTERDSPVKVTGLGEIVAIAAGYNFSLALKRDGTVMAWGRNSSGQLGDGTSTGPGSCGTESPCSTTPVAVIGLSGVRSISAGFENGLADLTNGTVKAWGGSVPDVLGTNSELGESTTPVTVLGLSEAIAVAAVEYGGLALNANGTVMTWGDDTRGEIGDGTVNSLFSPITTVDDLGHAVSIAAGESFNLAVVTETEPLAFKAWALSGTITPKPLGQAIALPSGSSFNGSGELNTEANEGTVSGTIAVPPFKASPKLFGVIPVSLGMTVTQSGAIGGTIAPSKTVPGDETLTLPVKLNLGFTSFGLLGLNIPTNCATSQPVSLTLTDTLTKEALVSKGWAFSGTGTIPKITCQGGLLGALYGGTISELISGAGASYSLSVKAPGS